VTGLLMFAQYRDTFSGLSSRAKRGIWDDNRNYQFIVFPSARFWREESVVLAAHRMQIPGATRFSKELTS